MNITHARALLTPRYVLVGVVMSVFVSVASAPTTHAVSLLEQPVTSVRDVVTNLLQPSQPSLPTPPTTPEATDDEAQTTTPATETPLVNDTAEVTPPQNNTAMPTVSTPAPLLQSSNAPVVNNDALAPSQSSRMYLANMNHSATTIPYATDKLSDSEYRKLMLIATVPLVIGAALFSYSFYTPDNSFMRTFVLLKARRAMIALK